MWRLATRFVGLGGEMALPPLVLTWLGSRLEARWGLGPWATNLGAALGLAAAARALWAHVRAGRRALGAPGPR